VRPRCGALARERRSLRLVLTVQDIPEGFECTAYAASQFGRETIGSSALKKEAVTPAKLSKKAKTTLIGATGPAGPQGNPGAPGAPGATKIDVAYGVPGEGSSAHCPAGQVAVGGGGEAEDAEAFLFVSEPLTGNTLTPAGGTPNGWFAKGEEGTTIAYALCASP
jgi:hypothetical protein